MKAQGVDYDAKKIVDKLLDGSLMSPMCVVCPDQETKDMTMLSTHNQKERGCSGTTRVAQFPTV